MGDATGAETIGRIATSAGARFLWTVAGIIFVALGLIGIAVPLLPTTPFLLLAAACFLRGSERMYRWLLRNKLFGRYLDDYREKRGVPMRIKIIGICVLWASIGFVTIFLVTDTLIRILMLSVAFFVTLYMLTIKTKTEKKMPGD
jgi:hypothetical protein